MEEKKAIKQLIGLIIKHERTNYKEKNIPLYTQEEMIGSKGPILIELCDHCKQSCSKTKICSIPTLVKIEKGIVFSKNCYYIGLAEKLGYEYNVNRKISNELNRITDLVLSIIEFRELPLIKNYQRVVECFYPDKKYIYYSHIIAVYNELINFLNENIPSSTIDETVSFATYAEPYLNTKNRIIFNYFLAIYQARYLNNMEETVKYRNIVIELSEEGSFTKEEAIILNLIVKNDNVVAYNRLLKTYKQGCDSINSKLFTLAYLNYFMLNTEKDHNSIYIEKYEEAVYDAKDLLPQSRINSYHNQIGILYYSKNDYSKAATILHNLALKNINTMVYNAIVLYDAINKSNLVHYHSIFNDDLYQQIINKNAKIVFKYIIDRTNTIKITKDKATKLEDYILYDINGIFSKDSIHQEIFFNELKDLVKITNNYKKILVFTE